ncbi:hypothetical protein ACFL13_02755, partial [Patescibacteria group bacterium]
MPAAPFYPGYRPDKPEPTHIPGYYPGKTIPRKYRPKKYSEPIEYQFDQTLDFIDDFDKSVDLSNLPRYYRERVVDDFKQNLKAQIKPRDIDPTLLDDYDLQALPGAAGISINLNPADWIEDPGKEVKKTLKGWWKTATNLQDLDTMAKKEFWGAVTGLRTIQDPDTRKEIEVELVAEEKSLKKALEGKAKALGGREAVVYDNPLSLLGLEVPLGFQRRYDEMSPTGEMGTSKTFGDDAGIAVAKAITEFQEKAGSALTLGKEHDNVRSAMRDFTTGELNKEYKKGSTNYEGLDDGQQDFVNSKLAKFEVSSHLEGPTGPDKQLGYVRNKLKRVAIEGETGAKSILEGGATGEFYPLLIDAVRDQHGNLVHSQHGNLKSLSVAAAQMKQKIEEAQGTLSGREKTKLLRIYNPIAKRMSAIEGLIGTSIKVDEVNKLTAEVTPDWRYTPSKGVQKLLDQLEGGEENAARKTAAGLLNKVEAEIGPKLFEKDLVGGNFMSPSLNSLLLMDIEDDLLNGELGEFVKARGLKADRLKAHARLIEYDRQGEAIDGLIHAWEKGNLTETLFWSRVPSKFKTLTPAYWTQEVMKRTHYLGLDINEEYLGLEGLYGDTAQEASWFADKFVGKEGIYSRPNAVFGHHINLKTEDFGVIKVFGGQHFEAVGRLRRMMNLESFGEWTSGEIAYLIKNIDSSSYGDYMSAFDSIIRDLNEKREAVGKAKISLQRMAPLGREHEDLNIFYNQIVRFKKYLNKNKKDFGNVDIESEKFLGDFIKSLSQREGEGSFTSIIQRYAGLLEKVRDQINRFQIALMNRFGKWLKPVFNLRRAATEVITTFFINALEGLAAGATGGPGAAIVKFLGKILRPVIKFVVDKVGDFVSSLWKGIMQGDIVYAIEGFFKSLDKMVQATLKAMFVPILIILMAVLGVGGSFTGA